VLRLMRSARAGAPLLATLALSVAGLLAITTAPAGAVSDEAAFAAAWQADGTTSIVLDNDITLTCDSGAPFRNSGNPITVDGAGHTLEQTCPDNQVMSSHGAGAVTLQNITLTGGHATGIANVGGALFANGDLTVTNSTITHNQADSSGGGLIANGTMTVRDSTISGNRAGGNGAGISGNNASSAIVVINSTISGNVVTEKGIGGGGVSAADLTLVYSTVVGNSASIGANLFVHQATHVFRSSFGSVVASPKGGGDNCGFQFAPDATSNGYNFSDDDSCHFTATGDREDAGDPLLGALAGNGGPTRTMAPLTSSPLLDAIPIESCQADGASGITTDQRGVTRPQGSACDIGAVEVEVVPVNPVDPTVPPVVPPAPAPVAAPARFTG
jgi:Putative pectate lyase-like adhesive domain